MFLQRCLRYRYVLLAIAMLAAVICAVPASRLTMDRTIETMFARNDPLLEAHHRLKELFGGNEIVMCVYDDPALMAADQSGLQRLSTIRNSLAGVDGVSGVLALDMPLGDRILDDHYVAEQTRKLFQGYTHGADGRTACVACMLQPRDVTETSRAETIERLREIMKQLPDDLPPGIITGEPVMLHDAFQFLDEDGRRLMITTTLLLGLVILCCFRSLWWVAIPLLVVQLALLMTRAILYVSHIQLTMVSSMLTAVVTVVGVATVVHVIVRYREGLTQGLAPRQALTETLERLAAPVSWACITDAAGFGALLAASVQPVRAFGLMMAIGSLAVLVSCGLLIPSLALMRPAAWIATDHTGDRFLNRYLLRLLGLVNRFPVPVAVITVTISLLACWGVTRLKTETDFTRNFRSSTEIVQSYEVVESKLGGAGVFDIVVPAPQELSWRYLVKLLLMEQQLRKEVQVKDAAGELQPGLTKVLSLADAIYRAAPSDLRRVRRDRLRQRMINTGLKSMRDAIPEFYDALYTADPRQPDQHYLRIMLRATERQPSEQKQQIIAQVRETTAASFPEGQVTGYFVLLTNLIDSILRDQWRTFGVALAAIFSIMWLALRHARLALVAVIPNVVPILIVNGMMGWLGLRINMGAAMIAAVSMGLSIDGSIHYMLAYQRERRTGTGVREALQRVQQTVARAMVFSTLSLIVGFSAMATSPFVPTVYFGTLVSLSMLCTLLGTLLWLPMLVRWVEGRQHYARPLAPVTAE